MSVREILKMGDARLLPLLMNAPAARVVPLASIAARQGRIDFSNLESERSYKPIVAEAARKAARRVTRASRRATCRSGSRSWART